MDLLAIFWGSLMASKGKRILLKVKVQTRARNPGIEKIGPSEYNVRVRAAPSKGEANKQAIKLIADYFGLPPTCVTLFKGHSSPHKWVSLEMADTLEST